MAVTGAREGGNIQRPVRGLMAFLLHALQALVGKVCFSTVRIATDQALQFAPRGRPVLLFVVDVADLQPRTQNLRALRVVGDQLVE